MSSREIHIEQRAGKLWLNDFFLKKIEKYFSYPFSLKKNILKIQAYQRCYVFVNIHLLDSVSQDLFHDKLTEK